MKGEILAALYSFGCRRAKALRLNSLLSKSVKSKKVTKDLIWALKKLEPYPFYRLIALANNISDPFDFQVVQAYWTGNKLLEAVGPESVQILLKQDLGIEDDALLLKVTLLLSKIKSGQGLPFHTWTVFYFFGKAPQVLLKKSEKDLTNCAISWGKIKEIRERKLVVESQSLEIGKEFSLSPSRSRRETGIEAGFISNPKIGEWVSIHLGQARKVLDPEEVVNLKEYIQKTAILLNKLKRKQ